MRIFVFLSMFLWLVIGCERIDGNRVSFSNEGYYKCIRDMECGIGRYCSNQGICSIDCVSSKDCMYIAEKEGLKGDYYCSACGRCLPVDVRDTNCIISRDVLCRDDEECRYRLSEEYSCSENGLCVKRCSDDKDCKRIGRGWSCGEKGFCSRKCICDKDCYFFGWGYKCLLPEGVDESENCNRETPIYGECVPREGGIDWGKDLNRQKTSFDYVGVWGWNINYAVRTTGLPLVSQQDSVSIAYGLAKIIQNSRNGIDIHLKLCSIRLMNFKEDDSEFEDLAYIIVPDAYSDSIPVLVNSADSVPPMKAGATFDTNIVLDIRGARLPDPWNTPLPDFENTTYAYDQDRDGKIGMTTYVNGILTGEVYNVQRWWAKYHIRVLDRDRMSGLIDFNSEESIVGASNKMFLTKINVVRHPQSDRSYFRALRLPDDTDCKTVLEMKDREDSFLKFTPHYRE
jgi:hypothetical protein